MNSLGTVRKLEMIGDGYERRERLDAVANCPKCGQKVECWAETEQWTKTPDGRWRHASYGGAVGVCEKCHLLIADCLSDGFQVFQLGAGATPKQIA